MNPEASAPAFQTGNDSALRAGGLAGRHVLGRLHGGALELSGNDGGLLRIGPADVERMRVGYVEGRARIYVARIWRAGSAQPLTLAPYPHTWPAFAQAMRGFAGVMAGQGFIARIEGGYSRFDALFAPVLFGLLALGTLGISLFVLTGQPWWARLLVPALPVALFALFLKTGLTRSWPRPLRDLADLEGQLPPVFQGTETTRDKLGVLVGGRRR